MSIGFASKHRGFCSIRSGVVDLGQRDDHENMTSDHHWRLSPTPSQREASAYKYL